MKRALQALLIAPETEMRKAIETGAKRITIRQGHRDYSCGPVMLCCHVEPWAVMAEIWGVTRTRLVDVPLDDIYEDGFISLEHALEELRQFYPDLTLDSPVTVIRWDNARGKLVGDSNAEA